MARDRQIYAVQAVAVTSCLKCINPDSIKKVKRASKPRQTEVHSKTDRNRGENDQVRTRPANLYLQQMEAIRLERTIREGSRYLLFAMEDVAWGSISIWCIKTKPIPILLFSDHRIQPRLLNTTIVPNIFHPSRSSLA